MDMFAAKNKKLFEDMVAANIKRDGIESVMAWIGASDFFTAPASTRFHGSVEGGLCAHSIAVAKQLYGLAEHFCPGRYSKEQISIVAMFHDVCKIGTYSVGSRNVKNETTGAWEKVPTYNFDEQFPFGGHGSKSVYLLMSHGLKLEDDEAAAINGHMGFSDVVNATVISKLYETNMLAWLLHVADEAATYVDKL